MLAFTRFDPTTPAGPIAISAADVDLWAFELGEPEAIVERWKQLLSDDEKRRADRFVFDRDRNRWIVARGVLRHLLARYCGIEPIAIAFDYASAGKPSLAQSHKSAERVTFNLAHSHDRALLGVARNREIGVDLERVRDDFDPLPIARQFFFGAELAAIESAAAGSRREAFFRHWVAKEAVLKANGAGLSLALDSFGVAFGSDGLLARVRCTGASALDETLVVRMLALAPGWHGAVAASGEGWQLRFAK
ncbi:MAG TPA: 4'-phosphopantetheinyl transferase superfamily protein [Casimicrobiaceae bacterium]|nr:4'-phosphopantetheinyl transferase superfamily protein [Casimicrobiaceae bacterium]